MKNCKTLLLAAMTAIGLLAVGCDRTISQTEKVDVDKDGSVETKQETVTQNPDGTVTKSEETKKTEPVNP